MSSNSFAPNKSSGYNFGSKVSQNRASVNVSKSTYKKDDLQFSTLVNTNVSSGKSKLKLLLTHIV